MCAECSESGWMLFTSNNILWAYFNDRWQISSVCKFVMEVTLIVLCSKMLWTLNDTLGVS